MAKKEQVPAIRFQGFADPWEQRKLSEVFSSYTDPVDIPHDGYERLGIRSHAKGTFHSYVPAGHELQTAQMHRVAANKFIVNITFGWEHAVAVTDENDAGKLVSHRFPQFSLSDELDPQFLKFIILDERFRHHLWLASPGGAGRNRVLNLNQMLQYEIQIPCVAEQRKIAGALINIDTLITLHQRKYDKLVAIKRSMLEKMFPREGSRFPEIRFAGFTDPWEQRKLGEVASSFEYGLNAAAKEFDGVNKYLRITDIDDVSREFREDDLTSPDTDLSAASNYQLHNGEILFARTGASVGKSFIYRESDGLVYFAGFLIRARIRPEHDAEFVFQNTLGLPYEKYIQVTSQRSGQPGVNAQEYAEYSFMVPSLAEQKSIGSFLHQIDTLITLHQRERENTDFGRKET